jgi:hypothetical protein
MDASHMTVALARLSCDARILNAAFAKKRCMDSRLVRHAITRLRFVSSFIFIFVLLATPSPFAWGNDTTSVVIVGTVHNGTNNFNVRALTGILERVKPDLILVELDSSFLTPSMLLKPEFQSISVENGAVTDYLQTHRVAIRPYDIEGRNGIYERHNYFHRQRDLSKALDQAERDSLLRGEAATLLDAIIRFDGISRAFASETPEVLNSTACDVAMESKQYYANEGMVDIVKSVSALKDFTEFVKFKRDFWIARNNTMVTKIMEWVKLLRPNTVVVLCGFEHRYYLLEALKKRSALDAFKLKEYWTY